MDLTITLPAHVAAAWPDADEAAAWCLAAAVDHAREQALNAARDEANRVLAAAAAEWDGVAPPATPTPAERVAQVEADQTALRAQVREVGVTLATAAGVPQEQAVALIESKLAT